MGNADFHLGCDSLVRLTPEDLHGPFDYVFEWSEHPNYPEIKVASCELAAEHEGPCEMYVDTTAADTDHPTGHWIIWVGGGRTNQVGTAYRWVTAAATCDAVSANEHHCTRPAAHRGGHSFTTVKTLQL